MKKNEKIDDLKQRWLAEQEEYAKNHDILLQNIKKNMPELEKLLEEVRDHWGEEDSVYRFYHHSFKVYRIQEITERIVNALRKLHYKKDSELHRYFETIYLEGTCRNKEWQPSHNVIWATTTRPFLESFFHAKYFLEMAVKYGKELEKSPNMLPSGWAALLCLYNLR